MTTLDPRLCAICSGILFVVASIRAQNPQGTQFQVNSYTTDDQTLPDVEMASNGSLVVVWWSDGSSGSDSSTYSVQGQRYDSRE